MSTPGPSAGAAKVLDLARVSPPRLFFAMLHQRFTGVLQLQQPPPHAGPRAIWMSGGMPVFTDWAEPTDVLGQVLVEQRILDEAALRRALQWMAEHGGLLGQTLLHLQLVDENTLSDGLRRQCTRKLVHTFALRQGRVALTPCDHPLAEMARVNVLELVLTAVGKHYDEARVEQEMGDALRGPVRVTGAFARYADHFRFRPTDKPLLAALADGTTLDKLSAVSGASVRRAAQLVYVLWACQMLRVGDAAERRATRSSSPGRPPPSPRAAPQAATAPAEPAPTTRAPPAAAPADDDASFMKELVALERKIEAGANAFDLLGVTLGAGRREIRRAWSDLSRRLHPDALQARGRGHLRDRVGNVFAALSEAHSVLGDSEQREKLKEQIERGDGASIDATATVRAALEADLLAKEGDRFLKAAKFDRALSKYDEALRLQPDEPDFQAAATWCRYQLSAQDRKAALVADRELGTVLGNAPALARGHYFRGMVLKDLGRIEPAIAELETAIHHDPRLIDAERQLRVLMASQGQRGGRGLFGKR